jgi:hypothetical protein
MTFAGNWLHTFSMRTGGRILLLPALAVALAVLVAAFDARSARAQQDSTEVASTPALYGRLGTGIQASPLFGVSIRYNASRRLALQAAGLPGFWGGSIRGVAGGRGLYRLSVEDGYNLFLAGGAGVLFEEQTEFRNGLNVERRVETLPFLTASFGIETDVGDHVGFSGEVGGIYLFDGDESFLLPALGVGIHYYW